MVESVGVACVKCTKITNLDLDEAKQYNKNNPFICQNCLQAKPKEEPNNSRSQDSERYSSPDLIEQVQENKPEEPSPALKKKDDIVIHIPKLETLEDFEKAATGKVKEELDKIVHRRKEAEAEVQREQVRVNRIKRGFAAHNILGIVGAFIAVAMMLAVGTQILGSVQTQVNCATLPGNAGNHTDIHNATGWALNCENMKQQSSNAYTLLMVIMIVIIAVVILFVIRML